MQAFAIIPVNELTQAKTRLSDVLSQQERGELLLCMLEDVLDALEGVVKPIVVSPTNLKEYVRRDFELILEEEKLGLTEAVRRGNSYAMSRGAEETLFVPADAPLIKRHHVEEVLSLGKRHPLVISPARKGGVGIIYRRPPDVIPEVFTGSSFVDIQRVASGLGVPVKVYDSFYLSLDIDTVEDIREFMHHGSGTRTYEFLKKYQKRWR
ncbi:2-phospho-L-lactate guanylyltransferase [Candidatus Pyrohabitans sp.]